jgi:hypothetical protein
MNPSIADAYSALDEASQIRIELERASSWQTAEELAKKALDLLINAIPDRIGRSEDAGIRAWYETEVKSELRKYLKLSKIGYDASFSRRGQLCTGDVFLGLSSGVLVCSAIEALEDWWKERLMVGYKRF